MNLLTDLVLLLFCYLMGAFPSGLIIGKRLYGIDIRQHGSKNIGATNVYRVLGWKAGISVFALDVGKAAGALLFAGWYSPDVIPHLTIWCGVAVLLGNFFNVFLGFKGGKGVATSLGVFLALAPKAVLLAFLLFVVVLWLTKYVSLGSLLAAIAMPVLVAVFYGFGPLFWMMVVISLLVVWKHRANIGRLARGTESKIGKKNRDNAVASSR